MAWTVNELGLEASYRHYDGMIGSDELKRLHPQAKIPAMQIGDLVLFESVAICQHLCDITPGQRLLAPVGTAQRSIHNQWVSFAQSEVEAYLWHSFQMGRLEMAESATAAALELNRNLAGAGLDALEQHLAKQDFLLNEQFLSLTSSSGGPLTGRENPAFWKPVRRYKATSQSSSTDLRLR